MRWLPYALICSVFLASADFFVKLASNKISSSMGMFVYGATTFTVGLTWVSYMKLTKQPLLITQQGLLYSLAVGIAFQRGNPSALHHLRTRQRLGRLSNHPRTGYSHCQSTGHPAVA